jgi:hypothetical protein
MAKIQINSFYPSAGAIPSTTVDGNGSVYTAWELDDEARFNFVVPDTYVTGTDLVLALREATAGVSQKHQWQATVLLNGTDSEVFAEEYTSSSVADTLTSRSLEISTSGTIDSVVVVAGDVVSVVLKRIAAADTEDSNATRLYTLLVDVTTTAGVSSACSGRMGKIIDRVQFLVNESSASGFVSAQQIIDLCNFCNGEIAKRKYWKESTTLSTVADQASYDLLTLISYYEDIQWVRWAETNLQLGALSSRNAYDDMLYQYPEGEIPRYFFVESNHLLLAPVPSVATTDGLEIYYSYCPADLDCSSNYTPLVPSAHDQVYVYYACREIFSRERGEAEGHLSMYATYASLFERALARLLGQGTTPRLRVKPPR